MKNIKTVYHELFDEALERYNAKQIRSDRKIKDYYEKSESSKREKPFHGKSFYRWAVKGNNERRYGKRRTGKADFRMNTIRVFRSRNPQLRVFSAHLHMDEATPHLHIDFVPFYHRQQAWT